MKCKMRISGIKFNTCRRQKVTSFICLQLFAESGNTHSACRCHPCAVLHCVCVLAWSLAVSVITWDDVVLTLLLLFSSLLLVPSGIHRQQYLYLPAPLPTRETQQDRGDLFVADSLLLGRHLGPSPVVWCRLHRKIKRPFNSVLCYQRWFWHCGAYIP